MGKTRAWGSAHSIRERKLKGKRVLHSSLQWAPILIKEKETQWGPTVKKEWKGRSGSSLWALLSFFWMSIMNPSGFAHSKKRRMASPGHVFFDEALDGEHLTGWCHHVCSRASSKERMWPGNRCHHYNLFLNPWQQLSLKSFIKNCQGFSFFKKSHVA